MLCLESTKAAADIYSPVEGKIIDINTQLNNEPHLVNSHAESDGWIYKIQLNSADTLENLLSKETYLRFLNT